MKWQPSYVRGRACVSGVLIYSRTTDKYRPEHNDKSKSYAMSIMTPSSHNSEDLDVRCFRNRSKFRRSNTFFIRIEFGLYIAVILCATLHCRRRSSLDGCTTRLPFWKKTDHHVSGDRRAYANQRTDFEINERVSVLRVLQKWYGISNPSSGTPWRCPATWPFSTVTYRASATTRTTLCPSRWRLPRGFRTASSTYSRRGKSVSGRFTLLRVARVHNRVFGLRPTANLPSGKSERIDMYINSVATFFKYSILPAYKYKQLQRQSSGYHGDLSRKLVNFVYIQQVFRRTLITYNFPCCRSYDQCGKKTTFCMQIGLITTFVFRTNALYRYISRMGANDNTL